MTIFQILAVTLLPVLVLPLAGLVFFTHRTAKKVEAALPPSGRLIDVHGQTVHVRERGNGPAVLLIHGLGGQLSHFTYGVEERLAGDFRVVSVDRPGSGYSLRGETTPADLSTQAATIAALIDQLQLERPLVVGHSLGGALALTLALEHPGKVGALALVAPLTHIQETVPAAFKGLTIQSARVRKLVAWSLATPASISKRKEVLGQVFGPDPVPRDFAVRGGGLLSLRPSAFLSASADLQALSISMPRIEQRYADLRLPVSVLFGRQDRILDPVANGEALVTKVPGATLHLIDGGHMLPVTHSDVTATFIRNAAESALAGAPAKEIRPRQAS
jgi:pimeloyl-ACP methyl ester carboxylesterase